MKKQLPTILLISILIFSCTIYSCRHPSRLNRRVENLRDLPPFTEMFFSGGKGYEFRNENSNRVYIVLNGSSWNSVMDDDIEFFMPILSKYSVFIPEKFDREIGINYWGSIEERERYTIDNLLVNYCDVITEYLSQNNFESIVIYGYSQGAYLLPLVYDRLDNPNIKALVSHAGGGWLTYFEQNLVLREHILSGNEPFVTFPIGTTFFSNLLLQLFQSEPLPSLPEPITGGISTTFRYISSIAHLSLLEYYEKIQIPVLFLHGVLDPIVAVETTGYLENNLRKDNFTFIYFPDMGHTPNIMQRDWLNLSISVWLLRANP